LIGEINPEWYDVEGRKVFRPDSRRKSGFKPTFPAGRYFSQPLKHWCKDLLDLRRFLSRCKYVSDQEQFGERDYWQPPDLFEECKKGDCEDFAFWTWRQLLHMNYPARIVFGAAGRYGEGHARVTIDMDGKACLLEPLLWQAGLTLPRLSLLKYKPRFSMSWDGEQISYFEHADRKINWSFRSVTVLVWEWLFFWTRFFLSVVLAVAGRITVRRARSTG
jgi:Bacterial transglutaminase-like cysteine proteinase BTLCP